MRRVWILCGSVVTVAGIALLIAMGLAWTGGAAILQIFPSIIMGGLLIVSGWNFIVRGRQLSANFASEDKGEARSDHVRRRQMIMQAIRIGSLIVLGTALMTGLLIFFFTYRNAP